MAVKKQIAVVEVMCNTRQAVDMLNEYKRLATETLQKIEQKTARVNEIKAKGTNATAAEVKEMKQLTKEIKADTAEFNKYNSATQKGIDSHRKLSAVMKDLSGSKLKDLKAALRDLNKMMGDVSNKTPQRARVIQNSIQKVQAQINQLQGTTKKFGSTNNSVWQTAVRNITAYMGVMAGFNKIKSLVEGVFKANFQLSDSLANIRKVSGLTSEEVNKVYTNIAKIDSRNTIETLNNLAYTGAKLGIGQNYGVQGLTGFVKAAEQVQMALGEDMGEEALPALAKMTEVMGLIDRYGVEQSMQKAASAIFQLGASSTATGTDIVEFSKRLYGLANVSNVTAQDLMGLGSAASSMGLMPEVASTAFNKLFTSLQQNHNLIEKTLHIEPGTINELYTAGKTMDAIVLVLQKMKEQGNLNALGNVWKDLGSNGARLINVMATMSDRVDLLQKHLEISRKAFKDGTAVINEYMIQNETAAAKMDRASNLWAKAFVNPEGVDMVKQFADKWYEVSKAITQSESAMYSLKGSIEWIANLLAGLVQTLPYLIKLMTWFAVFGGFRTLALSVWSLITAINQARTATITWGAAMNTVVRSNVFLLAISALAAGVSMWIDKMHAAEEAAEQMRKRQEEMQRQLQQSKLNIEEAAGNLERYKKALDNSNMSLEDRNRLLKAQLTGEYQKYLDYLGIEIDGAYDLAKAYAMVVKVLKQKKAYEEREQYREEVNGQNKIERMRSGAIFDATVARLGVKGIDQTWLGNRAGSTDKEIADYIMQKATGGKKIWSEGAGLFSSKQKYYYTDDKGQKREVQGYENLLKAITDYRQYKSAEFWTNYNVNKLYAKDVGDYDNDKFLEETMKKDLQRRGALEKDKPDKAAIAAARKAEQEAKQALRKDLKDAKEESDAIIAKVEEWYRLQETVITNMATDGRLTQQQAEQAVRSLNVAKNTALRDARLAISGRDTEAWEQTKQQIGDLMLDQGAWSQELLQQILDVSMSAIRNNLARIDAGGGQYGITTSSLKDAVDKNAAGNQREIARLMNKGRQEVEKLLDQFHFVEIATKAFSDRLSQMGILSDSAKQIADELNQASLMGAVSPGAGLAQSVINASQRAQREQSKRDMMQAFIKSGATPYGINPENIGELGQWLSDFTGATFDSFGENGDVNLKFESWADSFRDDFNLWLRDAQSYKSQIQQFYFALIQSADDYYKAQRQQYEFYKKQNEQQWENSGRKEFYDQTYTKLGNQQQMQDVLGTGQSFGQQYGFVDAIANDTEVELYKQKLQAAAEYYQFVESHQHTEQELREQGQAVLEAYLAMAKKVGDEVAERASKIQELQQPATEFAEEVGQKWGDMMFNMESSSQTWNAIVKKMILGFAQMTIKMTAENLTKKIQQALFYKQMQAMEIQHQTTMLGIQTAFGAMRLGAEQSINATSQSMKTADDAQTVGKEISLATILTQLGISEGAAKTIGKLGWWGIPLVAVIASLLMGLLSSALSTANKSSTAQQPKTNVKLASGMLTYDEGNLGMFAGRRKLYDDGTTQVYDREGSRPAPFVGQDGHVYMATPRGGIPEGVSLVKHPIATTVNGQPSLVAEKGPEIVIGRRTTARIMMNEPRLLHHLATLGNGRSYGGYRGLRTFDEGNLGDVLGDRETGRQGVQDNSLDAETKAALQQLPAMMEQNAAAMAAFSQVMQQIQTNGIQGVFREYGAGSLDESMRKVNAFRKRYPV